MTEGLSIIRQNNFPERKVEEERIDKVETELNSISPQVKMRKTELSCCANYGREIKPIVPTWMEHPGWLHFVTIKL